MYTSASSQQITAKTLLRNFVKKSMEKWDGGWKKMPWGSKEGCWVFLRLRTWSYDYPLINNAGVRGDKVQEGKYGSFK